MFYILRITAAKVTLHLKKDWIKNLNNNFPLRVVFSLFSWCLICDETLYLVFDILRITSAIATHALRSTGLKQLIIPPQLLPENKERNVRMLFSS